MADVNMTLLPSPAADTSLEDAIKSLLNADRVELVVADYVCLALSFVVLAGYHCLVYAYGKLHPDRTMWEKVKCSRIALVKHWFDDDKNRIIAIQCIRSIYMVINALTSVGIIGIGVTARSLVSKESTPQVRFLLSCALYLVAVINFAFCILSLNSLHVITSVRPQEQFTRFHQSKAQTRAAALLLTCQTHFRIAWRFLIIGSAALLWVVSPYMLLLGCISVVPYMWWSDTFPSFSGEPTIPLPF